MTGRDRFGKFLRVAQRFGAHTVSFQNAAARRLDLTATELECFRLVQYSSRITASDLARKIGLTPASLTFAVDKLVARGFLSRKQDHNDRRCWLLQTNAVAVAEVNALYAAHAGSAGEVLEEFSDEVFEFVLGFMNRFADEMKFTMNQPNQHSSASACRTGFGAERLEALDQKGTSA